MGAAAVAELEAEEQLVDSRLRPEEKETRQGVRHIASAPEAAEGLLL